ncbi:MAG: phage tail protein [Oscillatoriales cyanobacterium RU_3_3]|nr:phage tail protein [Microcoleus sp. SM1_3_4]NJM59433.1 phage tail protein [Oscillatoriales cyanobacterium RU_3_3]NJR21031.1 phage tail protein [Richelia sp. CSU_2_1]
MISFGLVTEGITDQIVIENILAGYFNTPDLDVEPLQPERDKDNKNHSKYAGWTLVFDYCKSKDFQESFQSIDYIIIQIDTDVLVDSENYNYNIPSRDDNGNDLTPQQSIEKVIEKFRDVIGEDFYDKYQQKILFAISVNSIECWFLPLYYTDSRKAKVKNCLDTLNQQLAKKHKFTIDPNAKNPEYYREISKQYSKQKFLMKHYAENPSLKDFIEQLQSRDIQIAAEENW